MKNWIVDNYRTFMAGNKTQSAASSDTTYYPWEPRIEIASDVQKIRDVGLLPD